VPQMRQAGAGGIQGGGRTQSQRKEQDQNLQKMFG